VLFGTAHLIDLWWHWGKSPRYSIEKAEENIKKGIALNPLSDFAYANLGHLYLLQKRYDESVEAGEKAIELNPNGDYNLVLLAITFNFIRREEEAIKLFKEGIRRSPYGPAYYTRQLGASYRNLGRWDDAIAEYKKTLERFPDDFPAHIQMAQVYGMSGRLDEGRAWAAKILEINPRFSIEDTASWSFKYESDAERMRNALRKVGIPENPPPK
jgi:tetratricopeptide (TPR) repeat protein